MTIDLERLAADVRARCPEARCDVTVGVSGKPHELTIRQLDGSYAIVIWRDATYSSNADMTSARIAVLRAVLDAVDEQIGGAPKPVLLRSCMDCGRECDGDRCKACADDRRYVAGYLNHL
jgi:hypothetical protein